MLLHRRPIALSTAVIAFFALSIVGSIEAVAPFKCCERALLGAAIAYVAASTAVQAVNAIVTQAMIASHVNKDEDIDNTN